MKTWFKNQHNKAFLLSVGLCLVGTVISIGIATWQHRRITSQATATFERLVDRTTSEVVTRLERARSGLSGIRGLYAASHDVTRAEFSEYIFTRNLESEYPGVRGFGYVHKVWRNALEPFIASEKADDAPDFQILSLGDNSHPDLYVVKLLEPAILNTNVVGMDAGSEPVRRAAIEQAVDDGSPVLSGGLRLPQDSSQSVSMVIFWPVYENRARLNSATERRDALQGLVIAPMVLNELFAGMDEFSNHHLSLQLHDESALAHVSSLLYKNELQPGSRFAQRKTLSLMGRQLSLHAQSTPAFETEVQDPSAWLIGLGGTLTSLLLSLLLWQQASARARAEVLAQAMTHDLNRLALVAQNSSNAVVFTDLQRRITWVNAGFERVTGYNLAEVLGKNPALLQTPDTSPDTIQAMRDALNAGEIFRGEILNRNKQGQDYWLSLEIQPTHDEAGQVNGFMAIESDITERRQAQLRLESAMRDNEALINTLDLLGGVSVANAKGAIIKVNDAFCEMSGFSEDELLGHNHRIVSSGKHDQVFWAALWKRVLSGLPWRGEICNRSKYGELFWVDTFIAPFIDNEGQIDKFVSIRIDITDKKRIQDLSRRNADLLRGSIDALDDAFALFDDQDRLALFNHRYLELYNLNADMIVLGNRFEDIIRRGAERGQYASAIGRVDDWIQERLSGIHHMPYSRLTQKLADGRTLQVVERRMDNGYTVGFRVDITDLVRATEAAQEASRAKSQFLANMSHELRTPMNAILGMISLLRKTALTAQQADYASKSEGAAQSLLGLLNDILDLSKAESGKMMLDAQPADLHQLLQDTGVIVQAYVGQKPVHFQIDTSPDLPRWVLVDALRLKQVLINLCGNGVKFTEQGQVTLQTRIVVKGVQQVSVQFAVQDEGIGIAPENQAKIFEGFTQAEASTTRRFGGTGLGLSISQRLIELMGGKLELQSTLGQGSRFHFILPMPLTVPPHADTPPASTESTANIINPALPLQGMRILVAEDNLVNQQIARELLTSEGAVVSLANNGQEAVDMVRAAEPLFDAVLMDMQMPVMDGLDATRALRLIYSADILPIVAMTANAMDSDRAACLGAGMNDHVGKPFDLKHLSSVLRQVTRKNN